MHRDSGEKGSLSDFGAGEALPHKGIGESSVNPFAEGGQRLDIVCAGDIAEHRRRVEKHVDADNAEKEDCHPVKEPPRDSLKKAIERAVEEKHNSHAQGAPKQHDGHRGAAVDVERPGAVVPRAHAEDVFFKAAQHIFDDAAEQRTAEKDFRRAAQPFERKYDCDGAQPVHGVERGKNAAAAIEIAVHFDKVEYNFPQGSQRSAEHVQEYRFRKGEFIQSGVDIALKTEGLPLAANKISFVRHFAAVRRRFR